MTPSWADLLRLNLRFGRDRAQSIGFLAESMGASRRTIEKAVETLRRDGAPICTGSDGVWLTQSPTELRAAYRSLRARYISQAVGARVLLRTAARYEKFTQETLWSDVA